MIKRNQWIRLISVVLVLALLVCTWVPVVSAADRGMDYREYRPEMKRPEGPQWTEQKITCQSGENTLRGTMTVPNNVEGQMPVAVLLHGLNTDRTWCDDIAWILADNGIASVRFDFAGCGESDGAQEDMAVSTEVQDTIAILDYVEDLSITDPDNILVVGKSMGAVDAVLASQSRGDEIKAMCLWYPGFGVTDAAQHGFLLGTPFNPRNPPERLEIGGYTFGRTFLKEIQVLDIEDACAQYEGPVMILHGTEDFVAPIEYSFQIEHVFQDCTLNVVPGGFHGFFGFQEMAALNDMLEFFEANID